MNSRTSICLVGAIALALVFGTTSSAFADKSHDGKVVSVTGPSGTTDGKLVMTDKDGKNEHSHDIASSVKVSLDKKSVDLKDLRKGDAITVTTDDNGKVKELSATRSN